MTKNPWRFDPNNSVHLFIISVAFPLLVVIASFVYVYASGNIPPVKP